MLRALKKLHIRSLVQSQEILSWRWHHQIKWQGRQDMRQHSRSSDNRFRKDSCSRAASLLKKREETDSQAE